MTIHFDQFCREKQCKEYIEWDFEVDMDDHDIHHTSRMICVSCQQVGQSYNIEVYPDNCPYLEEIKEYKYEKEKEQTWRGINVHV